MNRSTKTTERRDRRVQRTRLALRSALMTLLNERTWDEIDVSNLCACADVGRSTFYEHYESRESLLTESFAEIGSIFVEQGCVQSNLDGVTLPFLRPLLEHMEQAKPTFRVLLGRRQNYFVREQFQRMLVELVRGGLVAKSESVCWITEATAHSVGNAVFGVINWWVSGNQPQGAAEIIELIESQIAPRLKF